MYYPMGAIPGSLGPSDFKSMGPSLCKPTNFGALDAVKEMQRQLNRAAQAKNISKITIDGDIGPATLRLVAATGPYMVVDSSSCSSVGTNALAITAQAKSVANAAGVPAQITQPKPPSPPSIVAPSGAIVAQPMAASVGDSLKNMSTTTMILLGVGVVGAGYFLTKGKKGRRK